jgi:hypothetical protein
MRLHRCLAAAAAVTFMKKSHRQENIFRETELYNLDLNHIFGFSHYENILTVIDFTTHDNSADSSSNRRNYFGFQFHDN